MVPAYLPLVQTRNGITDSIWSITCAIKYASCKCYHRRESQTRH
ncbi:unnamed protein product [Arabidopsis lyrata]|nr:unnamed protein product [Arabidopsis lyrata]